MFPSNALLSLQGPAKSEYFSTYSFEQETSYICSYRPLEPYLYAFHISLQYIVTIVTIGQSSKPKQNRFIPHYTLILQQLLHLYHKFIQLQAELQLNQFVKLLYVYTDVFTHSFLSHRNTNNRSIDQIFLIYSNLPVEY